MKCRYAPVIVWHKLYCQNSQLAATRCNFPSSGQPEANRSVFNTWCSGEFSVSSDFVEIAAMRIYEMRHAFLRRIIFAAAVQKPVSRRKRLPRETYIRHSAYPFRQLYRFHPVKSQFAVQALGNSRKYCQDACLPKRLHRRPSGRADPSWISDNSGVFRLLHFFAPVSFSSYSLFASFPFCILIIPSPQALSTSSLGKHSKTRLSAAQKKILPSRTHYPARPSEPRLCPFCRPHATRDVILSSLSPANP